MFTTLSETHTRGGRVPAALIETCMTAFEYVREGGDGGGNMMMMMFILAHLTAISWEEFSFC